MLSLSDNNQADVVEAFYFTSRYLDDLLNIANPYFAQTVSLIYPTKLQLNMGDPSDTEVPFGLRYIHYKWHSFNQMYDKQDDFNFEIVNIPFLNGDVPHSLSYDVYISQLICFARACFHVDDFNNINKFLTSKLLNQGYQYHKLCKAFS